MNRWIAVLGAMTLLGTGCTTHLAGAANACRLDSPPVSGEITYVEHDRLMAVNADGTDRRCLSEGVGTAPRWDRSGQRALVGPTRTLRADGSSSTGYRDTDQVVWSPAGTSLLAVTGDGRLLKRPATGGPAQDMTFLNRYDTAVYHPSGRAIVAVGDGDSEAGYGIYLADTTGALQATLADGETTHHIDALAWTSDGQLVFTAEHPNRWDLHRLDLTTGQLTTLASTLSPDEPITDVVTSPFPGGGIAWREGRCAADGPPPVTKMVLAGQPIRLPATLASAVPIGWLPDDGLVFLHESSCTTRPTPTSAGDVYVFRSGISTTVASGATGATVRAALPPPPLLPASIPSDAPV
jgi:hypothetical protein